MQLELLQKIKLNTSSMKSIHERKSYLSHVSTIELLWMQTENYQCKIVINTFFDFKYLNFQSSDCYYLVVDSVIQKTNESLFWTREVRSNITGVLIIKVYMGSYSDTLWIHCIIFLWIWVQQCKNRMKNDPWLLSKDL